MANIKVSEMTEATSFDDGDYTMIVQANQNKKISKENMMQSVENDITAIDNKISNFNTYSTEETNTGKIWIDNKPIYRKVIDLGTLGNKTSINVDGIYDTIVSFDGYIYLNDGGKLPLIEFNNTSFYRVISYDKPGDNSLKVVINRANVSNWDNWRLKIIVEYTKKLIKKENKNEI